jgi:hypothetical protein
MNISLIFSDKTTADSAIIIDGTSKVETFYSDLKHSDNSFKCKIPYSIALVNKIKADLQNNIKCFVKNDDGSNYFCGYIRKTVSFEKTQSNQPVSIELVSPSFLLDKTLDKGTVYINKPVTFIITDLLSKAGFTDIKNIGVDSVISVCSLSEDDNIKDVIDNVLTEYCKTYDFNDDGYFYTADILNVPSTDSITQSFNGDNIRESIKIAAKEREADYIEATWNKYEYKENILLFSDTSGQTDDEKCKITVKAGKYFADTPYNYLTYDSSLGTAVVYVTDITPKIKADSGITYSVTRTDEYGNDLGTSCMLSAHNNTADDAEITQLDIYGNAYINTGTNTNVSSTASKKKSVTINYLHDEDSVKTFVAAVANYYRYSCNTITFKSTLNFTCGTFISVTDYGIGTYYCRIVKKTSKLDAKAVEYEVETINDFTPAAVSSTKSNYNGANASRFSGFSDFTAPTVPVISSAVIDANGWATITITPSTDSESGVSYYKLYRKEGSETFSVLTMLNHTGSNISYVDKTVRKGFSYSYCVSAVDKVGNTSALSAAKSITAKVTAAPNPATGLTAVANTSDFIKLAWTAAVADTDENKAAYYIVSISRDGGTTWTVCDKSYGTTFYYYYDRTIDKYPESAVLKNYRFRLQTVSVNSVSSTAYAAIAVDYSAYGTWIPKAATVAAVAEENGIRLTWTDTNSNFYGSITYTPVISYSSTARTTDATKDKTYFYEFNRTLDGYPEKSTLTGASKYLKNYSIAVKTTDEKSGNSVTGTAVIPDESNYLQWLPVAPTIQSSVAGRNVTLILSESSSIYGTFKYRVQIKKISATADTAFFKPDLSTDPYSALTAYKNGSGYITTAGNTFSQTLPLNGQNDSSPAPIATSYQYSVIAENESGAGTSASTITVTALATGATDLTDATITENKIAKGAVTADKIHGGTITADKMAATDLSAGSAYFSKIAGNKGADANNFWSGLDGTTPELRVGNDVALENNNNDDAEYLHYIPKAETTGLKRAAGFYMKIKNFIISAVASIVLGLFRVKKKGAADSASFMTVNPTDSADSTTGTPAQTVNINGSTFVKNLLRVKNIYQTYDTIDLSDTSKYSADKWYPVVGSGLQQSAPFTKIQVSVQLNSGTKPSWSTHGSGFSCGLVLYIKSSGWGTTGAQSYCTDYSYSFCNENPLGYTQLTNSSLPVLYMRGGGKYFVYSDYPMTWTVQTAAYTSNSQSVSPVTSCPGLNFPYTIIYANINGNSGIFSGAVQSAAGKTTGDMSVGGALNVAGAQTNSGLITANGGLSVAAGRKIANNGTLEQIGDSTFTRTIEAKGGLHTDGTVQSNELSCNTVEVCIPTTDTNKIGILQPRFYCAAVFYWTGSAVSIISSSNISSITRLGTGQFKLLIEHKLYMGSMEDTDTLTTITRTPYFIMKGYINDSPNNAAYKNLGGIMNTEWRHCTNYYITINQWDNQSDSAVDPNGIWAFEIDYIE